MAAGSRASSATGQSCRFTSQDAPRLIRSMLTWPQRSSVKNSRTHPRCGPVQILSHPTWPSVSAHTGVSEQRGGGDGLLRVLDACAVYSIRPASTCPAYLLFQGEPLHHLFLRAHVATVFPQTLICEYIGLIPFLVFLE